MRDALRDAFTPSRLFNNALDAHQTLDRLAHRAQQHSRSCSGSSFARVDQSLTSASSVSPSANGKVHVAAVLSFDEESCDDVIDEVADGELLQASRKAVLRRSTTTKRKSDLEFPFCRVASVTAKVDPLPLDEHIARRIENFSKIPFLVPDLEQLFLLCSLSMVDRLLGALLTPIKMLCLPMRVDRRDVMTVLFTAVGVLVFFLCAEGGGVAMLYASLYHSVRSAATIKLFLLFSILEVSDKLLTSFTSDALEVLYASTQRKSMRHPSQSSQFSRHLIVGSFVCSCLGVALHSCILLLQVVTLNVAINSEGNSLLALLISNNFAEVKAIVFKKVVPETLFQVCCSDALERVQLVLFVACILAQQLQSGRQWDIDSTDLVIVMGGELLIDFIKHYFVATFNGMSLSLYREYVHVTLFDIAAEHFLWSVAATIQVAGLTDDSSEASVQLRRLTAPLDTFVSNPSRRCGFVSMPYLAVMIWCTFPLAQQAYSDGRYVALILSASILWTLKLCVHEYLVGSAQRYVARCSSISVQQPHDASRRGTLAASRGTPALDPQQLSQSGRDLSPNCAGDLLSMRHRAAIDGSQSPPGGGRLRRIASAYVPSSHPPLPTGVPKLVIRVTKLLTQLVQVERFDLSAGKKKDTVAKEAHLSC